MKDENDDFFPDSDVMYLTSLEPVIFMEAYEWEDEEDYDYDVHGSIGISL
jgi:uncharacterized protein YuzE